MCACSEFVYCGLGLRGELCFVGFRGCLVYVCGVAMLRLLGGLVGLLLVGLVVENCVGFCYLGVWLYCRLFSLGLGLVVD